MTREEKLNTMAALWDGLSRDSGLFGSPAWHQEVLDERQQRIAAGETRFMDWEQAKAYIRSRAS